MSKNNKWNTWVIIRLLPSTKATHWRQNSYNNVKKNPKIGQIKIKVFFNSHEYFIRNIWMSQNIWNGCGECWWINNSYFKRQTLSPCNLFFSLFTPFEHVVVFTFIGHLRTLRFTFSRMYPRWTLMFLVCLSVKILYP